MRATWNKTREKAYTGKSIASDGWSLDGIPIKKEYMDMLAKAGKPTCVAIGYENAVFYVPESGKSYLSPETSTKYPKVAEIHSSEEVRAVTFGVDGAYVVIGANRDYASDPAILPSEARIAQGVRIKCAALGAAGVWAVVDSDGTVRENGVDERIIEAMREKPVKEIYLSANSDSKHLIQYIDGTDHRRVFSATRMFQKKFSALPGMSPTKTGPDVHNVPLDTQQNGVYLVLRPLEMEKDHRWLVKQLGYIKDMVGLREFLVLQHWGVMVDNEYYHLHIKEGTTKIALSIGPLTPATIVVPLWKTAIDPKKRIEIAIEVIKAMGGYSNPEEVEIYEGSENTLMSPEEREKYALKEADGSKKGPFRLFTGEYNAVTNNCINFASSWITQIAATNPDAKVAHWVITEVLRQKVLNTADDMEAMAIDTSVSLVDTTVAAVDTTVAIVDTTIVTVEETSGKAKKMANSAVAKAKGAANNAVASAVTRVDNTTAAIAKTTATATLVLKEVSETLIKIIKDPSKMHELQDLVIKLMMILLGLPIPPEKVEDGVVVEEVAATK